MDGGYTGRMMVIDLSGHRWRYEGYPRESAERYLGGFGVNNRLFREFCPPGTAPLSEGNVIILGAGPLVGTGVPGAARVMASSRMPLSGSAACASGSMGLGVQMKRCGLDHVVITGRSESPLLLSIDPDGVDFQSAYPLWGADTLETTRRLWSSYPKSSVLTIGKAGEHQVHLSIAMIDACATAGRGGLGAVMGHKNLKAVVVRGSRPVRVARERMLEDLVKGLFERLRGYPMRKPALELGMVGAWPMFARKLLPADAPAQELESVVERFGPSGYLPLKRARVSCPSCFLPDKEELSIPNDGETFYSTSFLNAAIIGCGFAMESAAEAAKSLLLLDRLGLDFITLSNQAYYLLDLLEAGVIGDSDLEGLPPKRCGGLLRRLAVKVALREGRLGEALARGWSGALAHFGEETRKNTMLIRNQDCLYDPRVSGLGTMEFEQVVSPRGPTSASSGSPTYLPDLPLDRLERLTGRMGAGPRATDRIFEKPSGFNVGRLTRYAEDWYSLFSSLGLCNRHQINRFYNPQLISGLLLAVTGMDLEPMEIMGRSAGAFELYRKMNAEEGLGKEADEFPEAWFSERQVWGRSGTLTDYFGRKIGRGELSGMLEDYYDEREKNPG